MLFKSSILLVLCARLVTIVADDRPQFAPPGVLSSDGDSGAVLQPFVGIPAAGDGAVDDTKLIRELLVTRQSGCPGGYGLCSTGG